LYSGCSGENEKKQTSGTSHLSVAMTTTEGLVTTSAAAGTSETSSLSVDTELYFKIAVVFMAAVGTAGNALVLYALVASKQHKKHALIVNQNALDLFGCFFLMIIYTLKLFNIYLRGVLGYWLCAMLFSENLIWWGANGSAVNLAIIAIYRYLKVVHHAWSKRWLRHTVINLAMVFSWLVGIVYNVTVVFASSAVIDGVCYAYVVFEGDLQQKANGLFYIVFFYLLILAIFIFCYGRIVFIVRRQATVMAAHSGPSSSSAQTQSNRIQSNMMKTVIFVSAFYAITWLPGNVYIFFTLTDDLNLVGARYYVAVFIAFIYISANPFIYTAKFDPVREVLKDMIPCKKIPVEPVSYQEPAGGRSTNT